MKRFILVTLLAVFCLAGTGQDQARAEDAKFALGVRPLGMSLTPDQFVVGVQSVLGRVKFARFAPSIDLGFGDNVDVTTFNFDVKLDLFNPPKARAHIYAGLGPTISRISPDGGESDTEIGFSLLGGLKLPFGTGRYYNIESRFGFGDIPEFKLLAGIMFGFGGTEDQ